MRSKIGSFLLLFALLIASQLRAADPSGRLMEAPDDDAILREVLHSDSPYFYPTLMTRYLNGDTTLTLQDGRHLYYGYIYQPTYQPFTTPDANFQILGILDKGLDSLSYTDYEQIRDFGLQVMQTEPFSPSNLNFLVFAYGALGDTLNERINHFRLQLVIQSIQSTGSGLREKSPWHVIYFSHSMDIMGTMNALIGKRRVVSRTTEYIPLLERRGGVRGYYFDFSRVYQSDPEKRPDRSSPGWEFNGVPLRGR